MPQSFKWGLGFAAAVLIVGIAGWFGWSQWTEHQEREHIQHLTATVKESMQHKFNSDVDFMEYSLNVKDVSLVHKSGNEYAGFATVSSYKISEDHDISIEVIDDDNGGMWKAEPGAMMFLAREKLKHVFNP